MINRDVFVSDVFFVSVPFSVFFVILMSFGDFRIFNLFFPVQLIRIVTVSVFSRYLPIKFGRFILTFLDAYLLDSIYPHLSVGFFRFRTGPFLSMVLRDWTVGLTLGVFQVCMSLICGWLFGLPYFLKDLCSLVRNVIKKQFLVPAASPDVPGCLLGHSLSFGAPSRPQVFGPFSQLLKCWLL